MVVRHSFYKSVHDITANIMHENLKMCTNVVAKVMEGNKDD